MSRHATPVAARRRSRPRDRIARALGGVVAGAILVAVGVFALTSDAVGLTALGTVLAALAVVVGVLVLAQVGTLVAVRAFARSRSGPLVLHRRGDGSGRL